MSWQLFISALGLGLVSSFHCVGMCGAIAFSLPVRGMPPVKKGIGILLYNLGRISVYAVFGLLFGLLGRQIYVAGFQQWFSIIAGILILLVVLNILFPFHLRLPVFRNAHGFVQTWMSRFLKQPHLGNLYLIGVANGMLPCGLVYFAITGALVTGSVVNAMLFMATFGLGTLPAMFAVSYFGYMLKLSVRQMVKKAVPFFMAVMGMLLILRGMGLGIPYVSPFVPGAPKTAIVCH
ncbi:sulfite exporter TauE/SafE family protein [Ilyomonas limi]|uniref:Sulfite exporter TauE/SafE family protein n=1 Tax=Ilyomonas limi TaxID=2575867 RepID=A0A4U3L8V7_9BACT|nr:sulfite exporter TauE/SafE family protein [Ilyomonas limi]TKK71751.1 sulfite exporter TauE/SafE family protein [Ilyomonas limi]